MDGFADQEASVDNGKGEETEYGQRLKGRDHEAFASGGKRHVYWDDVCEFESVARSKTIKVDL